MHQIISLKAKICQYVDKKKSVKKNSRNKIRKWKTNIGENGEYQNSFLLICIERDIEFGSHKIIKN